MLCEPSLRWAPAYACGDRHRRFRNLKQGFSPEVELAAERGEPLANRCFVYRRGESSRLWRVLELPPVKWLPTPPVHFGRRGRFDLLGIGLAGKARNKPLGEANERDISNILKKAELPIAGSFVPKLDDPNRGMFTVPR
jgi:hypothetical protein